jgi:hypothetical protein
MEIGGRRVVYGGSVWLNQASLLLESYKVESLYNTLIHVRPGAGLLISN